VSRDDRVARVIPVFIALVTFVVFLPALRAGFVSWDDDKNFLANPNYRGLGLTQLRWMWSTFLLGHYVPLAWMTLGLDYFLWGMNPAGYHLTNVVLHAANAVILYFVARRVLRLTGVAVNAVTGSHGLAIAAAFAALLFSVHPLRVESVAWVTERRDVLSGFFYLLCVLFYLRHAEDGERSRRWYVLAVVAFACALLSKATAVTAPAVLLILNVYPLRRLGGTRGWWNESARRVYVELIPFAVLAAAAAAMTFVALQPMTQLTPIEKVAVSAYSLAFYLWKTIVPVGLSPIYAMPATIDPGDAMYLASYAVVIAISVVVWTVRRRWPGVAAAWLAFLAIIFPMLGFHQNGPQIAADRYTYHAAPVLAILAAAGLASLRRPLALAPLGVASALLLALGTLTWKQSTIWHDSTALWSHVLELDSASSYGHNNWGNLLMEQGEVAEATDHFARAVALTPDYAQAHNNLGIALARQGRIAEAVGHYQRALAIEPGYDEPQNNWGIAVAQQGDLAGAIDHYRQALAINPNNADAEVNWGNALVRMGKPDEAIGHYQEALRIRPDHADAHLNWGVALAQRGKLADAIEHFRQALLINPSNAEATQYLERATQLQGQRPSTSRRP
jgi:tetratricopeptide (TPR) repeat protein